VSLADDRLLAVAVEAGRAAGKAALKYYGRDLAISVKPDTSPVTQADREAERIIRDIVGRAYPDHGCLGEEYGAEGASEVRWIIDPIDGTRNFVRQIPLWAVLIGFEEEGRITAGVILNPVTDALYTARAGGGAFLNGERVRVSGVAELAQAHFLHAGLALVRRTPYWPGFVRLIEATERQRGFGDYYGYALVAEGKAEIYAETDMKPWDLAAPKIVVEEAGGRFTDLEGGDSIYSGSALATNALLHAVALELVAPRQPKC
jgi:histidinol-phosphatase